MRRIALIVASVALVIVGCSSKHSMVNPDWKTSPDSYTVLMSLPFVENKDDLPEYTLNFEDWFGSELAADLEKRTKIKPSVKTVLDEHFDMFLLEYGDGALRVPMPNLDSVSGLHGVVVCLNPIRFKRREEKHYSMNGWYSEQWLQADGVYSIVSVDEKQLLAYGKFYGISSF